jgi:hypothetical protein
MNIKKLFFKLFKWESWHYHLKYVPIAPIWLWYCIKARSFWFFTASNPSITFGGFEGESKQEIYKQLPPGSYPKSIYISPKSDFSIVTQLIETHEFSYPFVVKPNVGMMGFMFRKIHSMKELKLYHEKVPVNYIVQKLIDYPIEVSVFYYRMPGSPKGTVSGFLMRQPPQIVGDGESTLWQLIQENKSLKYKVDEIYKRHQDRLDMVLPKGEIFILSHASNRSQGGKLINLQHEIDEKLTATFDKISQHTQHFYYGRYDIKCQSIEMLKNGTGFSILEYNGAGAGIQHVYGNGLSLWQACRLIVSHWKKLYQISIHNNKANGISFWEYKKGQIFLKKAMKDLKLLEKADTEFPSF